VVIVGQYTDHGPVEFNPHSDLNRKHLDVRGCWGSDFSHFYRGVQIVSESTRNEAWSKMQLKKFGLSDANEALAQVASGTVLKALINPV
jgi:L-iditol 2-dehydrogenase